jgi:drug/metabolite transporter (DMT)-like permease
MWSSSGLFGKLPLFDEWPPETRGIYLAFWRAFFAAMVLAPAVRRPRWRPLLVPLAAAFTVMNVSFLSAMSQTTAANAIWLQATSPWWVFLLTVLVFREPVARRDLVPLAFGVLGVGLILAFEVRGEAGVGVAYGLIAGISYGAVVVSMRHLRGEDSCWLVALNHAVAMLVLLPWVIALGAWPSLGQLLVLAAFGAFQMAIPYLLLIRGLRAISSQEAVAIGMLEPILMPVWAYLTIGERPESWTIAGAALILVGLVLRYAIVREKFS